MEKSEFDLIKSYFAPLASGYEEAFDLLNDAALISEKPQASTVVTMDTLIAGVHFLMSDPAGDIARKCLRVNLSDLAAMGAAAFGYSLSMAYNSQIDVGWVKEFTTALGEDQQRFSCHLIGGDTVVTPGPLTITITCFGSVARHQCLKRNTAEVGEDVWVSGDLGDSAAGLKLLNKELDVSDAEARAQLIHRYRVPEPRCDLGIELLQNAISRTAMDVSDGLLADLGHIARASNIAVELYEDKIPRSAAFSALMSSSPDLGLALAVTGGDDYEIVFTSDPAQEQAIQELSRKLSLKLSKIGKVVSGHGVRLICRNGKTFLPTKAGWTHF
ncbi:thiamine-phosphate kinase [Kiloniella laminariae]|uniref:Thiamine-monophosphate kinase n=1 Tax=Kiloniella laminariae TaxID=454162 RepID=A0ABT4LGA9_9PROT|nr:thiamine-phosphate kinase [Kiloniella laminariae]MCZ4280135.1 thiamine-phosphate kinase [Kiloniella laminariae]